MSEPIEIPAGLARIDLIARINAGNRRTSEPLLRNKRDDLTLLGTSLSAIYIAATCHRKCYRGDHILEKLGARVYNLACASYSLISTGYYDEALNLVRSIGEIANLLSLSVCDKPNFIKWINSDKRVRLAEFSPAKIRSLVQGAGVLLMDKDWYGELCEAYTHITPDTSPNNFNEEGRNVCGGVVQSKGLAQAVDQLVSIVSMISLFYCKYFELDDLFDRIVREGRLEGDGEKQ